MDKDRQIEEIRKDIFAAFGGYAKWEEDWQSLAEALYNAGYRKQSELTPCDVCKFNPPTSGDNKPCFICPAQAKMKGEAE